MDISSTGRSFIEWKLSDVLEFTFIESGRLAILRRPVYMTGTHITDNSFTARHAVRPCTNQQTRACCTCVLNSANNINHQHLRNPLYHVGLPTNHFRNSLNLPRVHFWRYIWFCERAAHASRTRYLRFVVCGF